MTTGIKEFSSAQELLRFVDAHLAELRRTLGDLLRVIEDLRAKSELDRRIREFLAKLSSRRSEQSQPGSPSEIVKLGESLELVINPTPSIELRYLENLAESINKKIAQLQSVRKGIEQLTELGLEAKLEVIMRDDVPSTIIIKF